MSYATLSLIYDECRINFVVLGQVLAMTKCRSWLWLRMLTLSMYSLGFIRI